MSGLSSCARSRFTYLNGIGGHPKPRQGGFAPCTPKLLKSPGFEQIEYCLQDAPGDGPGFVRDGEAVFAGRTGVNISYLHIRSGGQAAGYYAAQETGGGGGEPD